MKDKYRYYLKSFYEDKWTRVSLKEFKRAESIAGFRVKGAGPTATGGFFGGGYRGRMEIIKDER